MEMNLQNGNGNKLNKKERKKKKQEYYLHYLHFLHIFLTFNILYSIVLLSFLNGHFFEKRVGMTP